MSLQSLQTSDVSVHWWWWWWGLVNPFLYRKNTIDFCQRESQKGIQMQSYRSLRDGKAFADPTVADLATKYNRSPAQAFADPTVADLA
ncbi:hypothetical protein T484DRAFT_1781317 [Baffinella frigidus]|nr:hypothetical protein T484DRAFT_1781317 [Cryptophyta sp. CCMP2293]